MRPFCQKHGITMSVSPDSTLWSFSLPNGVEIEWRPGDADMIVNSQHESHMIHVHDIDQAKAQIAKAMQSEG